MVSSDSGPERHRADTGLSAPLPCTQCHLWGLDWGSNLCQEVLRPLLCHVPDEEGEVTRHPTTPSLAPLWGQWQPVCGGRRAGSGSAQSLEGNLQSEHKMLLGSDAASHQRCPGSTVRQGLRPGDQEGAWPPAVWKGSWFTPVCSSHPFPSETGSARGFLNIARLLSLRDLDWGSDRRTGSLQRMACLPQ